MTYCRAVCGKSASTVHLGVSILILGNKMRQERNSDFYDGGILVAETACLEYLDFARLIFKQAKELFENDYE